MKRIGVFVLLICGCALADSSYEKGRLISITFAPEKNLVSTPTVIVSGSYESYHLSVQIGEIVYVTRYTPLPIFGRYAPWIDLAPNSELDVRIKGKVLHIKRPNGKEFGAVIEKRLDRTINKDEPSSNPRKAASKHDKIGNDLEEAGDLEGAENHFRAAVRLNTDDADAHFDLGTVLYKKRDFDTAYSQFQAALDSDPKHARAHCMLGMMMLDKGDVETSLDQLRTALRLDGYLALGHYGYGMALESKGNVQEALHQYREALRHNNHLRWGLDVDDREVRSAIQRVEKKQASTNPQVPGQQ